MSPHGGRGGSRRVAVPSASQRERRAAGPVTVKGQDRRGVILKAARKVFERQGFVESRVADIVAEARASQGTFYTYFDSKEAVFEEVAQGVVDSMYAAMRVPERPNASPAQRVEDANRRYVNAFRPNAIMVLLIEQVGTFSPEMRKMRLALREAFVDRAARGIRRSQQQGVAYPDIDPDMTAEVLGAMVEATCYHWFSLGMDFDEDDAIQALTSVWVRAVGLERF